MTTSPMTLPADARVAPDAAPKRIFGWLFAVAILAVMGAYVRAIYFTPIEAQQGAVQKIYYLHVPAWIACYLAYGLVAIGSVINLWLHDERADRLAASAAEVGILFNTVGLTVGPVWAKPIWGTWWTWDARLTSTLFLWFIFAAYLVLRGAIESPAMRARFSAVLAILGVLLIPFIHLSVYLFRTLHPMPIMLQPQALVNPPLSPEMETTFLVSSLAFLLLCVALVVSRYRLATLRAAADDAEGVGQ
ncbi:MAG TPA: cytochrome c biogenesis protein CcsA [Gemmatimonadaceae bacterium]|nr:cytochrome c biogenesis protein CcsA [Gemmatimonadaceae bacterium]